MTNIYASEQDILLWLDCSGTAISAHQRCASSVIIFLFLIWKQIVLEVCMKWKQQQPTKQTVPFEDTFNSLCL